MLARHPFPSDTAVMKTISRQGASSSARDDALFLPDFCNIRLVFGVVVIAELLAFVLVLVDLPDANFWHRLGLVSLFIQWVGLTSAAFLCGLRPLFARMGNTAAATVSYLLLLLITALLSEFAFRILLLQDLQAELRGLGHGEFLLRNLAIGVIVHALVLRYLYVQHQWRRQVEAEALARLQALQARIRPHFLFNSLNTIAALTRSRPAVAEEAVQDLADLFRATLGDARDRVSLAEEIAITRQYVQLETLRLGERLDVDWELIDLPEHLQVPSLMLQPLVENAIYHGIEPLAEGGVIRVWARADEHQVIIRVSNPTAGERSGKGHDGNRIAQDNIRQRLALAYGERGSLRAGQKDDRYEVELRLPREVTP
jgi:two-component system, LytTR family, sensor histidine kinase AlgZ